LVAAAKFLVKATKIHLLSLILLPQQNHFFRDAFDMQHGYRDVD